MFQLVGQDPWLRHAVQGGPDAAIRGAGPGWVWAGAPGGQGGRTVLHALCELGVHGPWGLGATQSPASEGQVSAAGLVPTAGPTGPPPASGVACVPAAVTAQERVQSPACVPARSREAVRSWYF